MSSVASVGQSGLLSDCMGKSYHNIVKVLASEGPFVSKRGIQDLKKVKQTGSIHRKPRSGRQSKKTSLKEMKTVLEKAGGNFSNSSIHCWYNKLGWSSKSTKYCQMIKEANIEKP